LLFYACYSMFALVLFLWAILIPFLFLTQLTLQLFE
jgi:hypothetical protein